MSQIRLRSKLIKMPSLAEAQQIIDKSLHYTKKSNISERLYLANAYYAVAIYNKYESKFLRQKSFNSAISLISKVDYSACDLALEKLLLYLFSRANYEGPSHTQDLQKIISLGLPKINKLRPRYIRIILKAIIRLAYYRFYKSKTINKEKTYNLIKQALSAYRQYLSRAAKDKKLYISLCALSGLMQTHDQPLALKWLNRVVNAANNDTKYFWVMKLISEIIFVAPDSPKTKFLELLAKTMLGDTYALTSLNYLLDTSVGRHFSQDLTKIICSVVKLEQRCYNYHLAHNKISKEHKRTIQILHQGIIIKLMTNYKLPEVFNFVIPYFVLNQQEAIYALETKTNSKNILNLHHKLKG